MVNKIGLSNFFKLYEYFGKTEMYHLYRLYNTCSVSLEFKQDAIKFKLFKLSLDGLRKKNDIMHRARLEERK